MQLASVVLARAYAMFQIEDVNPSGTIYYPDIAAWLVDRFHFQKYPVKVLALQYDMTTVAIGPAAFNIQRREGASFGENKYYSVAPVRTSVHLDFVDQSGSGECIRLVPRKSFSVPPQGRGSRVPQCHREWPKSH